MEKTWRDVVAPIIRQVIAEVGTEDAATLRAALFEAYPFGQRKYHPYKIWLSEIQLQLGKKPRKRGGKQPARYESQADQRALWS